MSTVCSSHVSLECSHADGLYRGDGPYPSTGAASPRSGHQACRRGQYRGTRQSLIVRVNALMISSQSRIVQLQEKKAAMVDATLSPDDSAMGRLTPEDLGFLFRVSGCLISICEEVLTVLVVVRSCHVLLYRLYTHLVVLVRGLGPWHNFSFIYFHVVGGRRTAKVNYLPTLRQAS